MLKSVNTWSKEFNGFMPLPWRRQGPFKEWKNSILNVFLSMQHTLHKLEWHQSTCCLYTVYSPFIWPSSCFQFCEHYYFNNLIIVAKDIIVIYKVSACQFMPLCQRVLWLPTKHCLQTKQLFLKHKWNIGTVQPGVPLMHLQKNVDAEL